MAPQLCYGRLSEAHGGAKYCSEDSKTHSAHGGAHSSSSFSTDTNTDAYSVGCATRAEADENCHVLCICSQATRF